MNVRKLPDEVRRKLSGGTNVTSLIRCVEELIYNSLDARSNSIAIRIDLNNYDVQVIDNGHGIELNDLKSLGLPHSTSKCAKLSDLYRLSHYYGYKGEFLCNLGDVAENVRITSRASSTSSPAETNVKRTYEIDLKTRRITRVRDRPSIGVTVTVSNLFHRMPVVRKRLQEITRDRDLIVELKRRLRQLTLINHDVTLTLRDRVNNEIVFNATRTSSIANRLLDDHRRNSLNENDFIAIRYKKDKQLKILGLILNKMSATIDDVRLFYVNKRAIVSSKLDNIVRDVLKRSTISTVNDAGAVAAATASSLNYVYVIYLKCCHGAVHFIHESKRTRVDFDDTSNRVESALVRCIVHALKRHDLWPTINEEDDRLNDKLNKTINNEAITINNEGFPINNETLPINNEALPIYNEAFTINNEALPTNNDDRSINKKALPINNEAQAINDERLSEFSNICKSNWIRKETRPKVRVDSYKCGAINDDEVNVNDDDVERTKEERLKRTSTEINDEHVQKQMQNELKREKKKKKKRKSKKKNRDVKADEVVTFVDRRRVKSFFEEYERGTNRTESDGGDDAIVTKNTTTLTRRQVVDDDDATLYGKSVLMEKFLKSSPIVNVTTTRDDVRLDCVKRRRKNTTVTMSVVTRTSVNYRRREMTSTEQFRSSINVKANVNDDVEERQRKKVCVDKSTQTNVDSERERRFLEAFRLQSIANDRNSPNSIRLPFKRMLEENRRKQVPRFGFDLNDSPYIVCQRPQRETLRNSLIIINEPERIETDTLTNVTELNERDVRCPNITSLSSIATKKLQFQRTEIRDDNRVIDDNLQNATFVSHGYLAIAKRRRLEAVRFESCQSKFAKTGNKSSYGKRERQICELSNLIVGENVREISSTISQSSQYRDEVNAERHRTCANLKTFATNLYENITKLPNVIRKDDEFNRNDRERTITIENLFAKFKSPIIVERRRRRDENRVKTLADTSQTTGDSESNAKQSNKNNNNLGENGCLATVLNNDKIPEVYEETVEYVEGTPSVKEYSRPLKVGDDRKEERIGGGNDGDDCVAVRHGDVNGEVYVDKMTGMTYYERPHRQAIGNFRMRKRPDFVPKGMSPLLDVGKRDDCKSLDVSLTDGGKIELLVALMSMQGEGDVERELARVKWQNYEDYRNVYDGIYETRSLRYEREIPKVSDTSSLPGQRIDVKIDRGALKSMTVVGQWDRKFIIAQFDDELYAFDQHAVDERIRLERLLRDEMTTTVDGDGGECGIRSLKSCECRLDLKLRNADDLDVLGAHAGSFRIQGLAYEIIEGGTKATKEATIRVNRLPSYLIKRFDRGDGDVLRSVVLSMIETEIVNLRETGVACGTYVPRVLRNLFNLHACRGAIKFGDSLTSTDCENLLINLARCTLPFQCAHGRPTVVPLARRVTDFSHRHHGYVSMAPNLKKLKITKKKKMNLPAP